MRIIVGESQAARTECVLVRVGVLSIVVRAIEGGAELAVCQDDGSIVSRETYTGREAVTIADRIGAIMDGE